MLYDVTPAMDLTTIPIPMAVRTTTTAAAAPRTRLPVDPRLLRASVVAAAPPVVAPVARSNVSTCWDMEPRGWLP
jgi:hypothetical protein